LASPDHFTACDPRHLEASNRLPKILSKLEKEIENKPIFCLQEVSHAWAGKFHVFFANHRYHFVTGLYGKKFNGYMGIGVAYPIDRFETLNVDIARLSDYREEAWPRPPEEETESLVQRVWTTAWSLAQSLLQPVQKYLLPPTEQKPVDHWEMSENRHNILLFSRLRDRESNTEFGIANYHMPCAFYAPMVMTIHAEMATRRVQNLASGIPHIFCGDFNILPNSSTYKLITTGALDTDDPSYPTQKFGLHWKSNILEMRSAYALTKHGEPDFTNYAAIKDSDPFIGTLDYIFLSNEWKVLDVDKIPHRDDVVDPPFPNEEEPSDHVLIAANLQLKP